MQIYKYTNIQKNKLPFIGLFGYLFIGLFGYLFITAPAGAVCVPVYGGGPTCTDHSLAIQSQILSPTTNHFVHNLTASDSKFGTNDLVTFQLVLTNTGSTSLQNVIVKDTFPTVLKFADGPGQFNTTSHVLTFSVPTLEPKHSQLFTVSGHVGSQDTFPTNNNSCVINRVSALATSGSVVEDSSQFCLETLTTTPATGTEGWELLALLPIGFVGLLLTSPKFLKQLRHNFFIKGV